MPTKILFICLFLIIIFEVSAQNEVAKTFDIGLEIQQYPTGFLLGVRAELGWAEHHSVSLRVGTNLLTTKILGFIKAKKEMVLGLH